MKVKYIQQKESNGCLVACIAMVLGWPYYRVRQEFKNDFQKHGTNCELAKRFICEHGFSAIEKRGTGFIDVIQHNKRMMKPFAPIHILTVKQYIDSKINHSVVMDSKGNIYNPHGQETKNEVLFYEAVHIMGFFKT